MFPTSPVSLSLAAAGATALSALAWGVLHPRSSIFGPLTWHGPRTAPRVALTFDDGPHPDATPAILDALGQAGARAAFFVIGRQAARWPDLVRRIAAEGHLVCNHTWDHHHWCHLGGARYWRSEIERTSALVADLTGRPTTLFRPPFGFKTSRLFRALRETNHAIVSFSVRGMDGFNTTAARVTDRILRRVRPGDIVSLHDGRDPHADRPRLAAREALPGILRGLRERALQPAPLESFFEKEAPVPAAVTAR